MTSSTINAVEKVRLIAGDLMDTEGELIPKDSVGHAVTTDDGEHYKLVFKDTNRRDALQGRIAYIYITDFNEVCEIMGTGSAYQIG